MAIFKKYVCANGCNYYLRTKGTCKKCGDILEQSKNWSIQYVDKKGRRHTKTMLGTSKRLAEDVLSKKKTEVAENKYLDIANKTISFADAADEYLRLYTPDKRAPKRDEIIFRHLKDYFKNIMLDQIDETALKEYRAKRLNDEGRKGKNVSPATVGREFSVLKTMFKQALKKGYIKMNPMEDIKIDTSKEVTRYLTDEERERLFNELSEGLLPLFKFISETGCRYSEAAKLTWENVDIPNKIIYLETAKTSKGEKQPVHLSIGAVLILEAQDRSLKWVFKNPETNDRWKSPQASFRRAAKRAGLVYQNNEVFRIHDLRHDFCSRAATKGVDIITIAELARHKDLRSTKRYIHLNNVHMQNALEKMSTQEEITKSDVEPNMHQTSKL